MTGRTHMAVGAAAALLAAPLASRLTGAPVTGVAPVLQALLGGMVGGMLPDTDVATSTGSKELRRAWAALAVLVACGLAYDHLHGSDLLVDVASHFSYEQIAGAAVLVATCAVGRASGHRGFSHSIPALVFATFGMWMLCKPLAAAFGVGYLSHLVLDVLNKKGIRLLWPMRVSARLGLFESGGVADWLLLVAGIATCAIVAAARLDALPAWIAGLPAAVRGALPW